MNHHYSFSRAIAWLCALFLIASLPSPLIYATAAAPLPPESPEPGSPNPNPPSQPPPPAAYDEWTVTLQPLSDASQGHLYRGYLQHYGSPADGIYDLQVRLFATPGGDTPIGDAIVYAETPVSAGEFILPLSAEPGNLLLAASWIEISVRPTGRAAGDPFTVIPRLPLQAAQSQPGEPSTPLTDVQPQMPLAPGDFTLLTPSPVNLTCVTSDPTSGLIYAQEDNGTGYYVYDPGVDSWSPLASAPLNSGNNGGAAYQGGKIYTVYTGNNTTMGVYDIASNTWSTMPNGLGGGTGVIASDGTYLYLASYSTFKRYDPVADEWANLTPPSIVIEPWGGMAYWNGRLYVHHGNGATEFAMYEIATGVWTTLPSLPSGAVLGSAIDPVRRVYYAYGSYDGNNWYAFNLDSQSWITETIPFFNVEDGGMTYVSQAGVIGIYFIQGEGGSGFARLESVPPVVGDFTYLGASPMRLTCLASNPFLDIIYAQENNGTIFYAYYPALNKWIPLASAPLNSGNNGGAAYLGGKIYTVYTGNNTTMGVYDIASYTWSTMPNGLGAGTGVIASDGTYLYLAYDSTFKRYDPVADEWANLTPPSIVIEPWGGMAYWNGRLYAHHGNGATEFAMYEIATGVWTTLPSLPSGAVLGSAIDPVRRVYYAYGSYDGNNWYAFDLDSQSWITETIPFFNVADGGMLYLDRPGFSGVYLIQGEAGFDLARYRDSTPSEGSFAINNGAGYVNVVTVTLDVSAQDPQTGLSYMRFRNEAPWKVLVFQDAYPWNSNALQQSLALNSLPYDQLDSSAMASADLASYPLVIIPSDQPQGFYDTYNANHTRFDDYASQGGTIEFHAAAGGANGGSLTGIPLPAGVNVNVSYQSYNYMLDPAHPLVAGLPNPIYGSLASHGYFSGMPGDAQIISTEGNVPGGHPTLIEFPVGSGKAVLSTQTMEFGWQFGQPVDHILDNMPLYLAAQPWAESAPWVLTPGDGVKTVYGAFRNGAGLWSSVYTDTIILDTQAPQASATCLPEASELFFDVNWSGSDALSGVATYDVQYRLGSGGAWTDWPGLLGTTQTSATFGPASPVTVERGETYSFRVRAHDAAGNVSSYAPAGDCSTYVKLLQIYLPITLRN